jgi:GNAT superfamily N-acetyltransferase
MKSIRRHLRRLPELMRWRNPGLLLLLIVRETFRPFIYWYIFDIFERDVRRPMPEPYSKERLDLRIYEGAKDLHRAVEDLTALDDLRPADIELRLKRGDAVAIAYAAHEAVACMWLSFSNEVELAFGINWSMSPTEALRYDAFVRPDWRGRAIHSLVNDAINRYARERGIARTLAGISTLNNQSRNLPKHLRNARLMRLILLHIRGLNWTYRKAIGAPFESRFSITPGSPFRGARPQSAQTHLRSKITGFMSHLLSFQTYLRRQSRTRL